jgi:hypothetical protein
MASGPERGRSRGNVVALYQILYSSVSAVEFGVPELRALLEQARRRNREVDVSGVLVYFAPTREFFQVLEGEESVLRAMMERIEADGRHRCVIVAVEGEIVARSFRDWSMGFLQVDGQDPAFWPGFARVLQDGIHAAALTGRSSTGLRLFELIRESLSAAESTE